jgi:hypothetical protein
MFGRILSAIGAAGGLLAVSVIPAVAHTLTVTVTATCACEYTVTASGNTDANAAVTVDYAFTETSNGVDFTVTGQIKTNADSNGDFSETISGIPLPGACTNATVSFSGGSANLTHDNTTETGIGVVDLPSTLDCTTTPPPSGKTFDIGPSSMEGHLLIRPGDWISGGYSFKFVNGVHDASTVTVSSTLTLPFRCADGTTGQFVINLGTHSYDVPENNTDWQPTGDANSVLSWAGSGLAPAGCGPGNIMDNSQGAIFEATVSQSPDTGSLLNWRFKYRDPNAKGKGNVNCLDTADPRRAKADVCGASWSETVRDP